MSSTENEANCNIRLEKIIKLLLTKKRLFLDRCPLMKISILTLTGTFPTKFSCPTSLQMIITINCLFSPDVLCRKWGGIPAGLHCLLDARVSRWARKTDNYRLPQLGGPHDEGPLSTQGLHDEGPPPSLIKALMMRAPSSSWPPMMRAACHSPTGAPAPAKPRPFLHPPAPVKRPNDRGVFAGFSYFY